MGTPDSDDIADELYLVPPAQFVAARDERVRAARATGNRELASELRGLRRPTQSAWLVNLLAHHDRSMIDRLLELGRDLRDAQERLDGQELRRLSAQRQELITDLLDQARSRAQEAGLTPGDELVAEVEGTLHAAVADPAAGAAVAAGHLTRPMAHTGFGPAPDFGAVAAEPAPAPAPPAPARSPDQEPEPRHSRADERRRQRERETAQEALKRAESGLASVEWAAQEQERELAEAEQALEAARQRWDWLERQRGEARREKAAAERRVTGARTAQRSLARSLQEARRSRDAAKRRLQNIGIPPDEDHPG